MKTNYNLKIQFNWFHWFYKKAYDVENNLIQKPAPFFFLQDRDRRQRERERDRDDRERRRGRDRDRDSREKESRDREEKKEKEKKEPEPAKVGRINARIIRLITKRFFFIIGIIFVFRYKSCTLTRNNGIFTYFANW